MIDQYNRIHALEDLYREAQTELLIESLPTPPIGVLEAAWSDAHSRLIPNLNAGPTASGEIGAIDWQTAILFEYPVIKFWGDLGFKDWNHSRLQRLAGNPEWGKTFLIGTGKVGLNFGTGTFVGYVGKRSAARAIKLGNDATIDSMSIAFARSQQGADPYFGIDTYRAITLKKGTIIYGGTPGQGSFYTTGSALNRVDYNGAKLWDKLQVQADDVFGLRTEVTRYEVLSDTLVAFGIVRANPTIGTGGFPQIVIQDFQSVLKPLEKVPLK